MKVPTTAPSMLIVTCARPLIASLAVATVWPGCPGEIVAGVVSVRSGATVSRVTCTVGLDALRPGRVATAVSALSPSTRPTMAEKPYRPGACCETVATASDTVTDGRSPAWTVPVTTMVVARVSTPEGGGSVIATLKVPSRSTVVCTGTFVLFPAASVATTWKVCGPCVRSSMLICQPLCVTAAGLPSTVTVVAVVSITVPVTATGKAVITAPSVGLATFRSGFVWSTTTLIDADF